MDVRRARDTSPKAAAVHLQVLRGIPDSERLALALEMSDELRALAADGVRQRHPDYSRFEVAAAVRELFLRGKPGMPLRRTPAR